MHRFIIVASAAVLLTGCAGTRHLSDIQNDNEHLLFAHSSDSLPDTYQRTIGRGRQCLGAHNVQGNYVGGASSADVTVSANGTEMGTASAYIISAHLVPVDNGTDARLHYYGRIWEHKAVALSQIIDGADVGCG